MADPPDLLQKLLDSLTQRRCQCCGTAIDRGRICDDCKQDHADDEP